MTYNNTKQKKLNFDNTDVVDRHRAYGPSLLMTDIDMVEFNYKGEPEMFIELKHGCVKEIDLNSLQMKTYRYIADKCEAPFFIASYYFPGINKINNKTDEFGSNRMFYLIPGNQIAKSYLFLGEPILMTEEEFVKLIYKIKKLIPFPDKFILNNIQIKLDSTITFKIKQPQMSNKIEGALI